MPAIQRIDDAGGEFGRGKMEDGIGCLFALADAVQQRQTGQVIDVFDAIPGVDGRPDDAWRNCANADIVLAELCGQLKSKRMNGALAGDRRTGREAAEGMVHQHRTNIDDGTAALGLHGGYRGLAGEIRALQVDRVVVVKVRLLDIEEGFGRVCWRW